MINQCLPTNPSLREDWVLWVELWLHAVRHTELRPVAEELYARHARLVRRRDRGRGRRLANSTRCDPDEVADRTLAMIDGLGIRNLIGDSTITLERARRTVEATLARDLGLGEQLVSGEDARGRADDRPAERVSRQAGG